MMHAFEENKKNKTKTKTAFLYNQKLSYCMTLSLSLSHGNLIHLTIISIVREIDLQVL